MKIGFEQIMKGEISNVQSMSKGIFNSITIFKNEYLLIKKTLIDSTPEHLKQPYAYYTQIYIYIYIYI